MAEKALQFDAATSPWVDRPDFEAELSRRLASGQVTAEQAELLRTWNRDGYVIFRQLIDHDLIDKAWNDYARALEDRPVCRALVEGRGVQWLSELPPWDELRTTSNYHYRFMDFHSVSGAAKSIMLDPTVVGFLRLIFGEPPVAMQTLMFEHGSEQGWHQDFPYVVPRILSHLAAAWAACEEVTPENGPLEYFPGSHRLPKFDWGGGSLTYGNDDPNKVTAFQNYLETAATERGIAPVQLAAQKGDVFLWHSALAHRGAPVRRRGATRKTLVTHYSTRTAYPHDQRAPGAEPIVRRRNGGFYYEASFPGHREDYYPHGHDDAR